MVKLDKIYTRGGDSGKTSLGGGERVNKHDPRVNAYGFSDLEMDELQSTYQRDPTYII